jgi:predicted transcriptional regulator
MAISNELSSEIAAALLAEKKSPQELKRLQDVILQVHSALQKLSADERAKRIRRAKVLAKGMDERRNC